MIIGGIGFFFMLLDALRHGMYLRRQVDIDSNVEGFTAAIVPGIDPRLRAGAPDAGDSGDA